jgi:hypothetical protein
MEEFVMRKQVRGNGLILQAVAGTYVVTLGWDIEQQLKAGLLGFAIQRVDHTENETHFMRGMKSFPNTRPSCRPAARLRATISRSRVFNGPTMRPSPIIRTPTR